MRPFRQQMRPPARRWHAEAPPATAALIAAQAAVFALQTLCELLGPEPASQTTAWVSQWLALSGMGIDAGRYWELLSYSWIHPGPLPIHMFANVIVLFYAGREVEPILGSRHLFGIYVLGNLMGGILQWLTMPDVVLMGASAGSAAVLTAFSTILPELEVTSDRFAFGDVRLKSKHLALALVLAAGLLWFFAIGSSIGPAAIIAGVLLGWVYVELLGFGAPPAIQRYFFEKRRREARLKQMSTDEFIHVEIDPILEKISRKGLRSLTRTERKILESGREKLGQDDATER
ncbi:MAG: Rhomboid family protein [Chthoniobacteraceae bacterium]|nr:Rhomboid family protein [Chthoniobacteraceae bacterium]